MDVTDPRYRAYQYRTGDGLAVIEETHRLYGMAGEGVFMRVTRAMQSLATAGHILDIGAGTGPWYRTMRQMGIVGTYESFHKVLDVRSPNALSHG